MNKLLSAILIVTASNAAAQISVTSTDFHSAGDNILVSNEAITTPVDITTTGASQTWDFSYFIPATQDTLSFLDVASTGTTYSLYFANLSFNPNRSNIATDYGNIPAIPGSPITITDPYSFYYKSTTQYKQQGLGATISGFQTPVAFNNKDILYNFPIDYLDADSSDSDWSFSLPGFGYYGYTQKRVNNVDGWGTLITPYGSFNALRMVTTIDGTDTAYLDTLGFGFAFPRPQAKEYKWFGTGQLIPLLQINTTNALGTESVSAIVYRDSLRLTNTETINTTLNSLQVFPSPAGNIIYVLLNEPVNEAVQLKIYSSNGAVVHQHQINTHSAAMPYQMNTSMLTNGMYNLVLQTKTGIATKRFLVLR
ncbi:MAG TPA: T9SS type A sorting domain-containing protein [Bacteroidia bacterium]|nr:T9SS type A sorting domain-containing protein [Bacteroidia bacterium]HNU34407.1 T9SS type A sorting domain-containing protein [Bacteroidia bacterium]